MERIVRVAKQIEAALESSLKAEGKGLREKVDSVAHCLSDKIVKRIRWIAVIRNRAVHESNYELNDCDLQNAEDSLPMLLEEINSASLHKGKSEKSGPSRQHHASQSQNNSQQPKRARSRKGKNEVHQPVCWNCRSIVAGEHASCPHCNQVLNPIRLCWNCHSEVGLKDNFCTKCRQALYAEQMQQKSASNLWGLLAITTKIDRCSILDREEYLCRNQSMSGNTNQSGFLGWLGSLFSSQPETTLESQSRLAKEKRLEEQIDEECARNHRQWKEAEDTRKTYSDNDDDYYYDDDDDDK